MQEWQVRVAFGARIVGDHIGISARSWVSENYLHDRMFN